MNQVMVKPPILVFADVVLTIMAFLSVKLMYLFHLSDAKTMVDVLTAVIAKVSPMGVLFISYVVNRKHLRMWWSEMKAKIYGENKKARKE